MSDDPDASGSADPPDTAPDPGADRDAPRAGKAIEAAATSALHDIDTAALPVAALPSAVPSRSARGLAFAAILIGGLCGGMIGYAFTDLQCADGCTAWAGVGGVVGALVGAIGVAIVAVLVMRAMDEWETIQQREPRAHPARRRPTPPDQGTGHQPGADDT